MNTNLPHIRLRAMEPEDLDALYRIENDVELWDVGATNVPYSRYLLHDYIANASNDIYTDRQVRLIIEGADGEIIGLIDLTNFDPKHRRAELGLVIERPHRRQGFARAVLPRIEEYAQNVLHLHQLYAVIAVDNVAACSLFRVSDYEQVACLPQWIASPSGFRDAIVMQRLFL